MIVPMQALREELRRQRSSVQRTSYRDEDLHHTTAHVDSEHNRQLESQIAEYIDFSFVFSIPHIPLPFNSHLPDRHELPTLLCICTSPVWLQHFKPACTLSHYVFLGQLCLCSSDLYLCAVIMFFPIFIIITLYNLLVIIIIKSKTVAGS